MAKKSKQISKPSEEEEKPSLNDSSDIFKVLFGREATQEPGLGLGFDSNPRNQEIKLEKELETTEANIEFDDSKKKKKREKYDFDAKLPKKADETKRRKKKAADLSFESVHDADEPESKNGDEENLKKVKRKKEFKPDSDVDSVATDEVKKRKKHNDIEVGPLVENKLERKVEETADLKEKKKKKRKRDEIEEAYEAKTYGEAAVALCKKEEGNKTKKVGEKRKAGDDLTEMMVSKEEFDDESKLLRTIFVGNLPLKLKKKALLKEFSKFGEVDSIRIRSVPLIDSKTPRKGAIIKGRINESVDSVHAYIVFKDEKSAQASLSHNMAVVGGNHIRVDKACPPRKKLKGDSAPFYDNQRTIFVGNLPFDVKDEEIYQLFCGMNQFESTIEGVRVIRDSNSSVGKGIAYVLFKTKEAANLVLKKRNLKIRDRDLRLYRSKSDATPSKKRNPPTSSADKSPGKRLAVISSGSHGANTKTPIKNALSYQGLKASKSIQKKEGQKRDGFRPRVGGAFRPKTGDGFRPRTGGQGKQKPSSVSGAELKQNKDKRPAVAARKAKALKASGASQQTGVKRKAESRTPDSFHRSKKARKL